jgi:HAD superfamily hydrolase (TIGR01459 family)
MSPVSPPFIERFSAIAADYDVVLSDVWGVVHNGLAAFPAASEALTNFRHQGGSVVLITNAPRPYPWVQRMLDRLGVARSAYDGIVSSGDVTREVITARQGQKIYKIGPDRDAPIFTDLDVTFVAIESADYVVCTGLFDDETETPEDYRPLIAKMRARGLPMVCANPDVVVERGEKLVYCAGAIADLYAEAGGEVLYSGKPYRPIYEAALARAAEQRSAPTPLARVLAIGDSVRTDLKGAAAFGVDCLFVTAGIHAEELGQREAPNLDALGEIFVAAGVAPRAVTRRLKW